MIFPILNINITGGYSSSHQALDLGWTNTTNEELLACNDGIVENVYYISDGGNTVLINYQNGYKSYFMHCSKINVNVGDRVTKRQVVAIMGATGTECTGPHCHFILKLNDVRVNPLEHCYIESWQNVSSRSYNYPIMFKKEEEVNEPIPSEDNKEIEPVPKDEEPTPIIDEPSTVPKSNDNHKIKCTIIKKILEAIYTIIKFFIRK